MPRGALQLIAHEDMTLSRALYAYEASEEDELSFDEGDLLVVLTRGDDGAEWWFGFKVLGDGFVGSFPYNFVADAEVRKVVALFAYEAEEDTELSFNVDDEFLVIDPTAEDEWYSGQLPNGKKKKIKKK